MNKVSEIVWQGIKKQTNIENLIEKVLQKCFEVEHINPTSLYICVTLTNPQTIQELNNKYRAINKPTDVLSFPMFEKQELANVISNSSEVQETLGDIIVSIPKVKEQAKEYGHSFERELAYMLVHGFYHLMGYDHIEEDEKARMREKEENVLTMLNITREEERLGNHHFIDSWKNAFNGIIYATTTQSNIKRQLLIAVAVVIISLFFDLNRAEFLCFLFTIVLIIFAEMVNTAIETVVDLYIDVYHPKAKIAKDVAAGGVVITTINAVIVAYFLFFDKIADIGLNFIKNVTNSPSHLAFAIMVITIIAVLALIAYAKSNKHKALNEKFVPSGHVTIAFAANTIIWVLTKNFIVLILSLIMAILIAESRIAAKEHKLSEVIFSACLGTFLVLILYGITTTLKMII